MKTKLFFLATTFISLNSFAQISQNTSGQTGFNNTTPSNRVEITSNTGDPYFGSVSSNGASGLRLTNLTSNKTPLSGSGKVLSVDANGDVILVPDNAGTGTFGGAQNGCSVNSANLVELGNAPGQTQASLLSNREIPQNNFRVHFSGNNYNDRVHIGGINGSISTDARLTVQNYLPTAPNANYGYGIFAESKADATFHNVAIQAMASDKSTTQFAPNNFGIYAHSTGFQTQTGVMGRVTSIPGSQSDIFGLKSLVSGTVMTSGRACGLDIDVSNLSTGSSFGINSMVSGPNGNISYGIKSLCVRSNTNYAGYFSAYNAGGNPGLENYGVYASATSGINGNYGIYAIGGANNPNDWAGFFNGDVFCTGSYLPSDINYKKEIKNLSNSVETLKKLRPVTYQFKNDDNYSLNLPKNRQYGFISQEVEKVLPDLTRLTYNPAKINAEGKEIAPKQEVLSLNYIGFIPLLTNAIQEQQAQIENQQQQIIELKALVNSLAGNTGNKQSSTTSIPVNLSDKNSVVLNQNVPNPFAESTVISYNIPNSFSKAQIIFSTNEGKVVKAVDITEKSGSLNVFANDLSNGIYQYSLVVDGKTIETKTMIKQ